MTKLSELQKDLKAPKGQFNSFGKYKYRSCEDILEGVKPLLGDATITLSDEIVEVGGRVYVKATATFKGEDTEQVTAYAREALTKKGMDDAQITGSASSYARKYALNGLLLIDDTKDADTMDNSTKKQTPKKKAYTDYVELVDKLDSAEKINAWLSANWGYVVNDLTKQDAEKLKSYITQIREVYGNAK